jgi:hypothetical protein
MSLLPRTKFGDCSCGCGQKNIEVVKVGKLLYCLQSYRAMKVKEQVSKANDRNKVRKLGQQQVASGNYFEAEKQALVNDLDFVFSRIVRMSAADSSGNCECFTCGSRKHWSLMQCGHFIKRANTVVRWDFRNARVQDKNCNENLYGNLEVFEKKLNEEYPGITEQLKEMATEVHKWSREELKQLLVDLRQRLRLIETKFNQPINQQS